MSNIKTNAMRLLESAGFNYKTAEYEYNEKDLSGVHAAQNAGLSTMEVFKTLVSEANTKEHLVFVIPVECELDLKKAAKAAGVKSIEMIHLKDLNKVTGYIRGGCSPIAMKKEFRTFIDETAILLDKIYVSGGKRGVQIAINPFNLNEFLGNKEFYDLIK